MTTTGDAHPCRRVHRSSGSSSISLALRRCGCSNASPASRSNLSSSTTTSVRTTTLQGAVDRYRGTWARVDAVIATSDLDTVCAGVDEDDNPDLRWVLAHLLEETARHAGHADILRELIDGQTGR